MKSIPATAARKRFGHVIDMAQAETVRIQRHGRDVAIVMSPEEFRRLTDAARAKVSPTVERLHAESAKRWASVYEVLAK